MFRVRVKEVWLSNLTYQGLLVRKSSIQLQREVLMPRSLNFVISLEGMIVLNAELKSMNSILTQLLLFSTWERCHGDGILHTPNWRGHCTW